MLHEPRRFFEVAKTQTFSGIHGCHGLCLFLSVDRRHQPLKEGLSLSGHYTAKVNLVRGIDILPSYFGICHTVKPWDLTRVFPRVFVIEWVGKVGSFEIVEHEPQEGSCTRRR